MALLSAIFSLLSRKLADLLQAIFGWSITGLFGRLPAKKQTALTVALVLSIAWPLLVVGVFAPRVAAWAIAFVPLHDFVSARVLRVVWLGLALAVPIGVAVLTRWVAPPAQKKGGVKAVLVSSVPLVIGFATAFLITFFIVPALKIAATVRGFRDDHVYVLVEKGAYHQVLGAVRAACATAELDLDERDVPAVMALPLRVLTWFARGALAPIVSDHPRMLRGDDLEIYLFPGDLLLRGKPARLARVRALLVTQLVNEPAHFVEAPAGQHIEDELHRLWHVVDRHRGPAEIGDAARERVREIARDLARADLPLDQWSLLHTNLNLLERAIAGGPRLVDPEVPRRLDEEAMSAIDAANDASMSDLIQDAIVETRDLIKLEVELAKNDARDELTRVTASAVGFGAALVVAVPGLTMLLVALVLAFGPRPLPALVIGLVLVAAAGTAVLVGYRRLPKKPFEKTLGRLETDAHILKEHTA